MSTAIATETTAKTQVAPDTVEEVDKIDDLVDKI